MAKMGRPTDALKHRFQKILESSNAYERLQQIMAQTEKEEVFLKALEICHDRAYGKAPQFMEMDLNDVTARPTIDDLNAALASVESNQNGNGVEAKQ